MKRPISSATFKHVARIGKRIKALRAERAWSTYDLGRKAQLSHVQIQQIEKGRANAPIETLGRIAGALGTTLEALCAEEDEIALRPPQLPLLVQEPLHESDREAHAFRQQQQHILVQQAYAQLLEAGWLLAQAQGLRSPGYSPSPGVPGGSTGGGGSSEDDGHLRTRNQALSATAG